MSFYNVGPITRFSVENDDAYAAQKIDFLLSNFNQPPVGTSINSLSAASAAVLSANAIVNGQYITITGASGITTATALEIITQLNNNQSIRQLSTAANPVTVGAGFNFNIILSAAAANVITAGTGVTLKNITPLDIGLNVIRVVVTNASSSAAAVTLVKLG